MLTIYRRHRKSCSLRGEAESRDHIAGDVFARRGLKNNCRCSVWVDGDLGGREIRRTLRTENWRRATAEVLAWDRAEQSVNEGRILIKSAAEQFMADAEDRALKEETLRKYRLVFRQLDAFADLQGLRFLKDLDVLMLRKFRASWKDGNLSSLKKVERLRSFLRFAQENGWLKENAAKKLGTPKCEQRPTLPFSHTEMALILTESEANIRQVQAPGTKNAMRLRALMLLLRYSGLRISDAVACSVDRLADGKLRLYTQKTGTHVHCPLPAFVAAELDAIPKASARYWFWSGNGKVQTAVTDWQGRLKDLFDGAGVQDGHAHRFRDTFATELLLAGVPIERVSVFLGHQNIKITQRHYSPWVRERQEQAEADVRRTWAQDPIALLATRKGTSEVHDVNGPVNQFKAKGRFWRRGWDSNPRLSFPNTRFPSVLLKPLGHLSEFRVLRSVAN
jgi:integrase/recombinase XerD